MFCLARVTVFGTRDNLKKKVSKRGLVSSNDGMLIYHTS